MIHVAENIFELETLKSAFDRDEIEYLVKEYKDTAYDGLFILHKGYAALYVNDHDISAALAIVKALSTIPHVVLPED